MIRTCTLPLLLFIIVFFSSVFTVGHLFFCSPQNVHYNRTSTSISLISKNSLSHHFRTIHSPSCTVLYIHVCIFLIRLLYICRWLRSKSFKMAFQPILSWIHIKFSQMISFRLSNLILFSHFELIFFLAFSSLNENKLKIQGKNNSEANWKQHPKSC